MAYDPKYSEHNEKYRRAKYHRIALDIDREKYPEIQAAAEKAGETVGAYCKKAIQSRIDSGV